MNRQAVAAADHQRVLRRLRQSTPPAVDRFAWLRSGSDRFSVFVPVLMGAGFVLSGLAWLVERLAHSTARPVLEDRLATRLSVVSLPKDHLVEGLALRRDNEPQRSHTTGAWAPGFGIVQHAHGRGGPASRRGSAAS